MSKFPKASWGHRAKEKRVLMSYSYNNFQPVLCTILDDQPYFYMDFEAAQGEADELDDFLNLEILEEGLEKLNHSLAIYDEAEETEIDNQSADMHMRMTSFLENIGDMTARDQKNKTRARNYNLDELIAEIKESRFVSQLLEQTGPVEIKESALVNGAFYNEKTQTITLESGLQKNIAKLQLIRALREAWQNYKEAYDLPMSFGPDLAVLANRAQQADLAVAAVRGAWELQLAGHNRVWKTLEKGSFSDLCRAWAREAQMDFRAIDSGRAAAAVFEAWFLSERCQRTDRHLIRQMLSSSKNLNLLTQEASEKAVARLLMALGEMPAGKNYLAPHIGTILDDPLFKDVRDRANANFLWFVKFEQSYSDAEQKLQKDEVETVDVQSAEKSEYFGIGKNEETSDLVHLFEKNAPRNRSKNSGAQNAPRSNTESADIILFRPG